MVLYIERWLMAEVQRQDGSMKSMGRGTPQGGVISPLLANLYLHYAFDSWMEREYPSVEFERYADDAVIHCKTEKQAKELLQALGCRLSECCLSLHPEKTKIVYCKDGKRQGSYPVQRFTFLGFTFEEREARNSYTRETFRSFLPAMSRSAGKHFRSKLKTSRLFRRTQISIQEIAKALNPAVRGFYNYFRVYFPSQLFRLNDWLDEAIVRWWHRKCKCSWVKAWRFLERLASQEPSLFYHWTFRLPGRAV